MRRHFIQGLALLCVLFVSLSAVSVRADEKVTLVYTNSLNGALDYCRCKSDPKGGLVKRATEIREIQKAYPNVVLFESGDFASYDPDPLLYGYLVQAYRHIKYDAILFGDQEFSAGIPNFLRYKNELPFVCDNIVIKNENRWEQFATRTITLKRGGLVIGVIGTIAPSAFRYYSRGITGSVRVSGQVDEIRKDVKALRNDGAGLVVLLSHSGYEADCELEKDIPGVDIIIGGHSQTLLKNPVKGVNAIIVQAGAGGAHIGILECVVSKDGIRSYKNSFRRPDENRPADDAYIRSLITRYQEETEKEFKKMRFK